MIVFNAAAIIQVIIAAIVIGIIQLFFWLFGIDYDMFTGYREMFVTLLIVAFVAAYTDAKGISGRMFYLPSWVIFILGAIFIFNDAYDGEVYDYELRDYVSENILGYQIFLYGASLLIPLYYFKKNKSELRKTWLEKQAYLQELKKAMKTEDYTDIQFWKIASHVFYEPPQLFLHANAVYKILNPNTVDENEFLAFYREFLSLIDMESLEKDKHKKWLDELKNNLEVAPDFIHYNHPNYGFTHLGYIINHMNERYNY